MKTKETLFKRRSIRKYKSRPVPTKVIKEILSSAMMAPSAGNEQPWHYIVITQRELLDKIPEIHPHSKMLKECTCAILVCGDLSLEKHKDYWIQDCSATTVNILLSATDLGLGSVWLGVYPREDRVNGLKKLFELPDNVIPFSIVALGYPDEEKKDVDRFKEERIHYNSFKNFIL